MARRIKHRNARKNRKGRSYRKKRSTLVVNKALAPFPQRLITKMKYSSSFNLTAISPTWNWNLNSLFDPDRAGIGHQPYGYDQLSALYNRYRVISCSYVITGYPSDTGFSKPIQICAVPVNQGTLIVNAGQAKENPRCKFVHQVPGGAVAKLRGKAYLPSIVGRTRGQYMADDRYQAEVGSNPQEAIILSVVASDYTNTNVNTELTITLEYVCEFFDVITQSSS